jgi:hypothetical protein
MEAELPHAAAGAKPPTPDSGKSHYGGCRPFFRDLQQGILAPARECVKRAGWPGCVRSASRGVRGVAGPGPDFGFGSAAGRQYHVGHEGRQVGPLSLLQLSQRRLTDDMMVWIEGTPDWVPITSVAELAPYVQRSITRTPTLPPPTVRRGGSTRPDPVPPPPPMPERHSGMDRQAAGPPPSRLVKTLGILHVVLASAGMLLAPVPAIMWSLEREGPLAEVIDYPAFWGGQLVFLVASFLLSLLLLFAGIGLLKRRQNGRSLSLVYGTAGIVLTLAATVFNVFGVVLPLVDVAEQLGTEEARATAIGYALLSSLGMCGGVYHIVTLVVMNLRSVKDSLS